MVLYSRRPSSRRGGLLDQRRFSITLPGQPDTHVNLDPKLGVVHKASLAEFKTFGKWLDLYSSTAASAAAAGSPLRTTRMKVLKGRLLRGQVLGCLTQAADMLKEQQPTVAFAPDLKASYPGLLNSLVEAIDKLLPTSDDLRAQVVEKVGGEFDAMVHGDDGLLLPATTAVERTAKGAAINKIIDAGLAATPAINIRARLLRLGQAVHFKDCAAPTGAAGGRLQCIASGRR